jgi:hypothetical protein
MISEVLQAVAFFYGPEAYFEYHTRGVKSGDVMKTPSIKMYLAGWNHYPEGQIRNARYLHLVPGVASMPPNQPVTQDVHVATEHDIRRVSTFYMWDVSNSCNGFALSVFDLYLATLGRP